MVKFMAYKTKRKVSYRSTNACGQPVPAIILEGNFLKDFGFNLGDTLNIEYQTGRIEIVPVGKEVALYGY